MENRKKNTLFIKRKEFELAVIPPGPPKIKKSYVTSEITQGFMIILNYSI